jgi:hypothetical protein
MMASMKRECILPSEAQMTREEKIGTGFIIAVIILTILMIGFVGFLIGEAEARRAGFEHGYATAKANCDAPTPEGWWGTDEAR